LHDQITLTAPDLGTIIMDDRLAHNPLAHPLTSHIKAVSSQKKELEVKKVVTTVQSPIGNRDEKQRAERMAEYREESSLIQARNMHVRDVFLENMRRERDQLERQKTHDRSEKREMWNQRMRNSPFAVDLLAENERIDEEFKIRSKAEAHRVKMLQKRKELVKNEIILSALSESDDLIALRKEKRSLAEEAKRLRAMHDLEKVGKLTKDAATIHKKMHEDRVKAQVEKRELRRQRLTLNGPNDELRRRTVMESQRPTGYA